ncbi:NAD(P)-dependent oxidoreductase [Sulfitobacter sp. JB4-11]|uniref:NAD(P)-dependent oxidoreductase n=1 Tax=Sulfitobacter rhodophyticola TaxID=3238304 RepID=UPI0035153F21
MTHPQIGFIGLGFMGHGMARNILASGQPLRVMAHRRREAVDDLVSNGAVEAPDLAGLAGVCDVIVLCVTGAEQVDDLVRRENGIGAHARAGTTIIDCTTSRPDTIRALAQDFPALTFIDAPLGRSPKEAWAGTLSVMVGASEAALAHVRPVFDAFTDTVQHVGPLGAGHMLKLVNNMVSLGYAALYAEAVVMAKKAGIAPEAFDKLISSSRMDCEFFQSFMGWVRTGDATTHKFALSLAEHVLADADAEARAAGMDLGLLQATRDIYAEAIKNGDAQANLPELPRSLATKYDVTLRSDGG